MKVAELRERLHAYIDKADERVLNLVSILMDADLESDDWWQDLPEPATQSIDRAIKQLEMGEGRKHESVMRELKIKYGR